MDERQVTKMIAAEAFTYAFWGCAAGCAAGLPLARLLYDFLIMQPLPLRGLEDTGRFFGNHTFACDTGCFDSGLRACKKDKEYVRDVNNQ